LHAEALRAGETDWAEIVALYDVLLRIDPSPVVGLNRAAALAMRDGPEAGLAAIEAVLGQGGLERYPHAHAARADRLRRLGRAEAARESYARALELTRQPAEQRFLERRLAGLVTRRLAALVSGGQTGVDQAALRAGQECGLEVGGWCPPGRACESGEIP